MNLSSLRTFPFLLALAGALVGCAAEPDAQDLEEDDLTSVTARERTLSFDGYVYVSPSASASSIESAIKAQTKSAFGALRTADISANTRELGNVDPSTFVKENVTVVDPKNLAAPGQKLVRVRYRYTDRGLVPKTMTKRGAVHLAVLTGSYQSQSGRILEECTENTSHDKEFEDAIWYVFNPSLQSCKAAVAAEQQKIDDAGKGIADTSKQVTKEESLRLYIPMTIKLESTKTSSAQTYPEYARLWKGGVEANKVVVSMISGVMADWAAGEKPETVDDIGYTMFLEGQRVLHSARPALTLVKSDSVDLTSYVVNGKKVAGAKWDDLVKWELDRAGFPQNITTAADQLALRKAVAAKIAHTWLTFEAKVSVKIGADAAMPTTIRINAYYGAETDETPHRWALAHSDVVVYNGHSYIGSGPLDPNRYDASAFPSSYQLFFFNSCVSFNYYEKDFFAMKSGGTKNLEMVTNGLESYVDGSGPAVARFVSSLLDGTQRSYKDLLVQTAKGAPGYDFGQDALRVVDGEIDNIYKPTTKIVVTQ